MKKQSGFTMVEVLVAMIVMGVGLLGVARIQALALSETSIASERSLAAIQAASLASSFHANRAYWSSGLAPAAFSIAGTTITDPTSTLTQSANCTGSATLCTAAQLAAYDVQQWSASLAAVLPYPVTAVACSEVSGTPVSCTIQISWNEKVVNTSNVVPVASAPTSLNTPTFTLYVEP